MQEQFLQVDVPAIVARLSVLYGLKSDAEVSRWLDRADNYVSLAKKRKVIDVGPILARVPPENWAYVLLQSETPGRIPVTPVLEEKVAVGDVAIGKALLILGQPSPEDLAKEIDAPSRQVRDWISGKSQPSHAQLVRLFNKVAEQSEPIAKIFYAAAASAKPTRHNAKDAEAA